MFIDCSYSAWSEWTDCSKPCDNGQQTRERLLLTVTNPNMCEEPIKDSQDCNTIPCPTTSKIYIYRVCRGHGGMVAGFIITYAIGCQFKFRSWQSVLDATLCDKVCQ